MVERFSCMPYPEGYLQQEIATVNLGKFRKLQHELEEAETRAMLAEKSLSQLRAMSRQSTSSVTETVSVCLQYGRRLACFQARSLQTRAEIFISPRIVSF